ncbi:GerMN domain-containing protein [Dactylosporangium sp. CA-139066]|uniref:GerMN domain-containing protein n=1 Tax=Dactylosporangium sp. CA-139066 TaxID=3239930 RepID=UPI003D9287CB
MRRLAPFAVVALLAAGCGVQTDPEPRPIEPSVTIGSYEGPMAPVSPGTAIERLYLVQGNQLVAVDRRVDAVPSPERQLAELAAGPTPEERDRGLDSALVGTAFITGVQLHNGTAIVGLAGDSSIRNDEILAYGQIVCTLAARADVVAVRFTQEGRPMEVPRADGALTSQMLTDTDYRNLIRT